jgi:hypothetical protein
MPRLPALELELLVSEPGRHEELSSALTPSSEVGANIYGRLLFFSDPPLVHSMEIFLVPACFTHRNTHTCLYVAVVVLAYRSS